MKLFENTWSHYFHTKSSILDIWRGFEYASICMTDLEKFQNNWFVILGEFQENIKNTRNSQSNSILKILFFWNNKENLLPRII